MNEKRHPCIHDIGDELPITTEVLKYRKSGKHRFHTPGHKGRGHFLPEILDVACDVTETGELDNLLNPSGCILRSMEDVNKAIGGYKTYFVTTGATTAILSAVYAVKGHGKAAILRSSHQSVYNALMLSETEPYIIDDVDEYGNNLPITKELLSEALQDNSVGVFILTRPDYVGKAFDIEEIGSLIKKSDKILVIDASHGAHFAFSKLFPMSCERFADIFILSNHKTLPTLTGGALLCVTNKRFAENVDAAYHIFHTTSPNYLVLMSIEYGVYMYQNYPDGIKELYNNVDSMIKTLRSSDVEVAESDDFSRLVIDAFAMEISGKELDMRLNDMGIYAEFSTMDKVVFILTMEDEKEDIANLTRCLIIAAEQCGKINRKQYSFPKRGEKKLPYLTAVNAESEYTDLKSAVGRVAARNFGIYPPCMPIAVAGEVITAEAIEFLDRPYDFYGVKDGKIEVIKEKR